MTESTEVIVVGGGMVGASLACLLGRAGVDVAVVEEHPPTTTDPADATPDLRVSSVNLASSELFQRAGAWDGMTRRRVCPFRGVRARDMSGAETRFDAREIGHDWFGWFVENQVILAGLHEALAGIPNVRWIAPARPAALTADATGASLTLNNGTEVEAELVIGADGARSTVRQLAEIDYTSTDYGLRALVVNVATELPQQDVTWQRFTPSGPQAFLPLPGHRASLVWYNDPDTVSLLESLDDETLAGEIVDAFPEELGGITAVLGRASFPIRRQHATSYTSSRVALVGDAAHAIHPLVGQGLNLGLQGVDTLVDTLLHARELGRDPGTAAVLADYEHRHRPRALAMMVATDSFHRLFTREPGPLTRIASGVLRLADKVPVGRRQVMRHAMGLPLWSDGRGSARG